MQKLLFIQKSSSHFYQFSLDFLYLQSRNIFQGLYWRKRKEASLVYGDFLVIVHMIIWWFCLGKPMTIFLGNQVSWCVFFSCNLKYWQTLKYVGSHVSHLLYLSSFDLSFVFWMFEWVILLYTLKVITLFSWLN